MLKKYVLVLAATAASFVFSCKGQKTTDSGLKYEIYTSNKGKKIQYGDLITAHLIFQNSKDSVLNSTYKTGEPKEAVVPKPMFKGSLEEGLTLLAEGDSARFWIRGDSLLKKVPSMKAQGVDSAGYLSVTVKIVKVKSKKDVIKERVDQIQAQRKTVMEQSKEQLAKDDALLQEYFKKNNLTPQKTKNGIYYIIAKEGKGPKAKVGDKVKVHYSGALLDGTKFDSSYDRKEPIKFMLGVGDVIQGWDEGIALLSPGTKATLFIPSTLGYGPRAMGPIPANAVLKFDVELISTEE